MPGSKTDYLEDALLAWRMGTPMPPPPERLYVALMLAPPDSTGGGYEVSGNGYARQPVSWVKNGNRIANAQRIVFPPAEPEGYEVDGIALFDALVGGRMTDFDDSAEDEVATGQSFIIESGALTITED